MKTAEFKDPSLPPVGASVQKPETQAPHLGQESSAYGEKGVELPAGTLQRLCQRMQAHMAGEEAQIWQQMARWPRLNMWWKKRDLSPPSLSARSAIFIKQLSKQILQKYFPMIFHLE